MPDTIHAPEDIDLNLVAEHLTSFLIKLETSIVPTEELQQQLAVLREKRRALEIQLTQNEPVVAESSKRKLRATRGSHPFISTASRSQNIANDEIKLQIQTYDEQIIKANAELEELEELNKQIQYLIQRCTRNIPDLYKALAEVIRQDSSFFYDRMLKFSEEYTTKIPNVVEFYRGFWPKFNMAAYLEKIFSTSEVVHFANSPYDAAREAYIPQGLNKERAELIKSLLLADIQHMQSNPDYSEVQIVAQMVIFFWFICNSTLNLNLLRKILISYNSQQNLYEEEYFKKISSLTNHLLHKISSHYSDAEVQKIHDEFDNTKKAYMGEYYTPEEIISALLKKNKRSLLPPNSAEQRQKNYKTSVFLPTFKSFMTKAISLFGQAQKTYESDNANPYTSIQYAKSPLCEEPIAESIASCSHSVDEDKPLPYMKNNFINTHYSSLSTQTAPAQPVLLISKQLWHLFLGKKDNDGYWQGNEQQKLNILLLHAYLTRQDHELERHLYNQLHDFFGTQFPHLKTKADELREGCKDPRIASLISPPSNKLSIALLPVSEDSLSIRPSSVTFEDTSQSDKLSVHGIFPPKPVVSTETSEASCSTDTTLPSLALSPRSLQRLLYKPGDTPPLSILRAIKHQAPLLQDSDNTAITIGSRKS